MSTPPAQTWLRLSLEPGEAQFLGLPPTVYLPLGTDAPLPDEPGFTLETLGRGLASAVERHPEMASRPDVLRFVHRRRRLADLERYLGVGNATFAGRIAREELQRDPEDPPALAALARIAAAAGDFAEAAALYARVLERAPSHARIRIEHAVALAGSGNPGEAVLRLRDLQRHPRVGGAARLWRYEIKRRGVDGLAEKLAASSPLLGGLGGAGESGDVFADLARLFPLNPEAAYHRAVHPAAPLDPGEREEALAWVVEHAPDHVPARVLLATLRSLRGDTEGALDLVGAGLDARPDDADLLAALGRVQELRGHRDVALDAYRRALAGPLAQVPDPAFQTAVTGLLRLGPPEPTRAVLADAAQARPDDPAPHLALARLEERASGLEAAERVLRDAARAVGPLPVLLYALGDVLRRQARTTEAEGLFKVLAQRHPRSAWGHRGLGDLALGTRLQAAVEHYARALEADPWTPIPGFDYVRGVAALREGNTDDAVRWLTRSAAGDPGNARTWCDLGAARFHAGAVDAAIRAGARAAALEPGHPGFAHNLAVYHRARFLRNPPGALRSAWAWWRWRRRARSGGGEERWRRDLTTLPGGPGGLREER